MRGDGVRSEPWRVRPVSVPEHGQYHREDEQKRNINIQYSGKYWGRVANVAPQHRVCSLHESRNVGSHKSQSMAFVTMSS